MLALSLTSCGPVAPSVDKAQFLATQNATSGPRVDNDLLSVQVLPTKTQVINIDDTSSALKDSKDIIKVLSFSKSDGASGLSEFAKSGKVTFEFSFDGVPAKQVIVILKTNKSANEISTLGLDAALLTVKQTGENKWSVALAANTAPSLAALVQAETVELTIAFSSAIPR